MSGQFQSIGSAIKKDARARQNAWPARNSCLSSRKAIRPTADAGGNYLSSLRHINLEADNQILTPV